MRLPCARHVAPPVVCLVLACDPGRSSPLEPSATAVAAPASAALSSYFPPTEAAGGWRATSDAVQVRDLGMDAAALGSLGSYLMGLPSEAYNTGVSGYNATNKAAIVIKNGWIVGEYYNQASAGTAVYYLASNGKSLAMLLAGRLARDYPELGLGLDARLYDPAWLSQGFPLSDDRKADITLDHVFRHVSGIIPEETAAVASSAVRPSSDWNFVPATVGKDADYPKTAPLYFSPGDPSGYAGTSTYSSVGFNHLSLIFRNVTGQEPSVYLRQAMLDPIGVGRMAYKLTSGMGDYVWATAGNGLSSARDFARIGYLMLHEGDWAGTEIYPAAWQRQFTGSPAYRNLRSNVDCRWGAKYPADMYRTTGSGLNWVLVVPSLDLLLTFNGRTPKSQAAAVDSISLQRLFAAVTERYVACDGSIINDEAPPPPPPPPPDTTGNLPPTAAFTSTCTGLACGFTDGSSDPNGTVVQWSWSFGDGGTSGEQSPSHSYASAGTYDVTLTVTNDAGATHERTERLTLTAGGVSAITLTATGREDATRQYIVLRWSGATSARIDIHRNGAVVSDTPNDGRQTVNRKYSSPATYVMKVCESGTAICSNEVTLVFD